MIDEALCKTRSSNSSIVVVVVVLLLLIIITIIIDSSYLEGLRNMKSGWTEISLFWQQDRHFVAEFLFGSNHSQNTGLPGVRLQSAAIFPPCAALGSAGRCQCYLSIVPVR